jgi:hypothetical protein
VWVQEGTLEAKRVWRGGFKIGHIGAEAWRAILDFCNTSLPQEQQVQEPPMLRIPAYDTDRLVPDVLRERIVELLAQAERVTLMGHQPNLQYSYGGVVHHGNALLHKMLVVSNAKTADNRVHSHETVFYINDDMTSVTMD